MAKKMEKSFNFKILKLINNQIIFSIKIENVLSID